MQITPAALRALNTQFVSLFAGAYEGTEAWWSEVATEVPSNTKSNTYGWAAKRSRMREWLGERVVNNLAAHSYAITNKSWENTIGVDADDFEDDNLGVYQVPVQELGEEAKKHPDDLVLDLMQNGHAQVCFDEQNFYDTDHPVDIRDASKGTQQNYRTSFALNQDNLITVVTNMMAFKGEDNRPMRVFPNVLDVPPQLWGTAKELVEQDLIIQAMQNVAGSENVGAAAVSNKTKGLLQVRVRPELANDPTAWYVHDTRKIVKPFVMQMRRRPRIIARMNLNDDNVFWQKKFVWGADARYNAGYALWFLSYKCVG
ncbi:MAG: Mu-like prophage major head subunit gpT family protein [Gammaproteobacteria bacterium]|nr:Mu-like prophage major head subunit gpT family protein [Gammaproteobacteria bacterium]